jgi:predicted nucleic acid-binding protein
LVTEIVAAIAILDACVLYPAPLRDLLMELAVAGVFQAKWTAQIHDEWTRNLLKNRPDLTPAQLLRTRLLMNFVVHDCLVTGYKKMIDDLDLPDPDDRHVLAAAIKCRASSIITFNLRDFPQRATQAYGVEAIHPNVFLTQAFQADPYAVKAAMERCRSRLTRPIISPSNYLDILEAQGLSQFIKVVSVDRLRAMASNI